jgi:hypothetical protein
MKEKFIPNKGRTKVLQIVDLGKFVILKIVGLKRAYEYSKIYGTVCKQKAFSMVPSSFKIFEVESAKH